MVKIMLITHGPVACAMKEAARMFCGDMADLMETIELFPSDSPEGLHETIKQAIERADDGSGVFIFVDIFAGTTCNMAAMAIEELKHAHKLECFAGVNMPLLIDALPNCATSTLEQIRAAVEEIAQCTIVDTRKALDI